MTKLILVFLVLFLFLPFQVHAQSNAGASCQQDSDCISGHCADPTGGNDKICILSGSGPTSGGNSVIGTMADLRSFLGTDKQVQQFGTLGNLVSKILEVVFLLVAFLMFIQAAVGIFQYITAGGNKEGLAKARNRIMWAVIGFVFVMVAYLISTYVQQVISPNVNVKVPNVSVPQ